MKLHLTLCGVCLAAVPLIGTCAQEPPRVAPTPKEATAIDTIRDQLVKKDFEAARTGAAALWAGGLRSAHVAYLVGMAQCFKGGVSDRTSGAAVLRHVAELPEQSEDFRTQLVRLSVMLRKEVCGEAIPADKPASQVVSTGWPVPQEAPPNFQGQLPPGTKWSGTGKNVPPDMRWSAEALPQVQKLMKKSP